MCSVRGKNVTYVQYGARMSHVSGMRHGRHMCLVMRQEHCMYLVWDTDLSKNSRKVTGKYEKRSKMTLSGDKKTWEGSMGTTTTSRRVGMESWRGSCKKTLGYRVWELLGCPKEPECNTRYNVVGEKNQEYRLLQDSNSESRSVEGRVGASDPASEVRWSGLVQGGRAIHEQKIH